MNPEAFGLAFAGGGARRTINVLRRRGIDVDAAQDIAQQAWLIGFARRHELRDLTRLQTWINKIAINLSIDLHRGRRVSTPFLDACHVSVRPYENFASIDAQIVLARVSERQRTLLRLVYIDQETLPDVARLMSISVQTLHQRLARARRAARRALKRGI